MMGDDMYTTVVISVKECDDESNIFFIKIELRQESVLNPYIFTLMIDEITRDIKRHPLLNVFLLIMWC
jgi:hypothetical protein